MKETEEKLDAEKNRVKVKCEMKLICDKKKIN